MGKFQELLNLRFKSKENEQDNKVIALAERSNTGELSTFSGLFKISQLSETEKNTISDILQEYAEENHDTELDKQTLFAITSEVKAITNQAVMLHGERIKKAQEILKNYKEGAFTAWLMATYGNRQTPYNFLQYYEFYTSMPQDLHSKIDQMPRQAIYTLASRSGSSEEKQEIVNNYSGQTKQELLNLIRKEFPLDRDDRRIGNLANQMVSSLKRLNDLVDHPLFTPSETQRQHILNLMNQLMIVVKQKKN
jgi:hypothetical protein